MVSSQVELLKAETWFFFLYPRHLTQCLAQTDYGPSRCPLNELQRSRIE